MAAGDSRLGGRRRLLIAAVVVAAASVLWIEWFRRSKLERRLRVQEWISELRSRDLEVGLSMNRGMVPVFLSWTRLPPRLFQGLSRQEVWILLKSSDDVESLVSFPSPEPESLEVRWRFEPSPRDVERVRMRFPTARMREP